MIPRKVNSKMSETLYDFDDISSQLVSLLSEDTSKDFGELLVDFYKAALGYVGGKKLTKDQYIKGVDKLIQEVSSPHVKDILKSFKQNLMEK